ncbi:procollagen C-endopeptidase enhancer 1 [Camelus ferus]|nr:procollagen C-endopeptidase enhancer 1 [Camelus ferus]
MLPAATASLLGPLLTAWVLLPFAQGQTPNYTRPVFLCGGSVTGESGYLASEGFPNHYPPNKECIWTVTVPESQTVTLSFRVFDLELHPSCRYDALEVFTGTGTSGQRLGRFCGTFRPAPLVAPGNQVTLRMTSDEGTGGRGFLLWYSGRATSGTEHQFCGGRLEKAQGTLTTPNWPESDYPPGISCSWHIIAPPDQGSHGCVSPSRVLNALREGVRGDAEGERGGRCERPGGSGEVKEVISLTFGKFDLEPDSYCRYDSVSVFNGAVSDDAKRLGKFCGDTAPGSRGEWGWRNRKANAATDGQRLKGHRPGPISSEGNELLVQFVSDLSVTADGFSASYRTLPRGATEEGPARSPGEDSRSSPPLLSPGPKPGAGTKVKPEPLPEEKLKALPKAEAAPGGPGAASVPCPKQCRRKGTLQSNFCNSNLVVTATVKSMVRGPGEGLMVTVSLIGVYKTGGLDLPSPPTDTSLKFYVPCKHCPHMKKGASYLLMSQVEENRGLILPPENFVVPYRPNQDQILTNLSKRSVIRHVAPNPSHYDVQDRFRIELSEEGTEGRVVGRKDITSVLRAPAYPLKLQGQPDPTPHPGPPSWTAPPTAQHFPENPHPQLATSSFLLFLLTGIVSVAFLLLPLQDELGSQLPQILHVSLGQKLVAAYVLGLLTMVFLRT